MARGLAAPRLSNGEETIIRRHAEALAAHHSLHANIGRTFQLLCYLRGSARAPVLGRTQYVRTRDPISVYLQLLEYFQRPMFAIGDDGGVLSYKPHASTPAWPHASWQELTRVPLYIHHPPRKCSLSKRTHQPGLLACGSQLSSRAMRLGVLLALEPSGTSATSPAMP